VQRYPKNGNQNKIEHWQIDSSAPAFFYGYLSTFFVKPSVEIKKNGISFGFNLSYRHLVLGRPFVRYLGAGTVHNI
jgi:hypothetical protein